VAEFKEPLHHSDAEATRAHAQLPGLDIEIVHRRSPDGDAEQIAISLQARPSFDAFASYLDAANPFAFWTRAIQFGWWPWLEATRALMQPWNLLPTLPKPGSDSASRGRR